MLDERRSIHSGNLVYCGTQGISTTGINSMFQPIANNRERVTRASTNLTLEVPKCKLELSKSNLRYRGAVYFNQLPDEIKQAPTLNAFKRRQTRLYTT